MEGIKKRKMNKTQRNKENYIFVDKLQAFSLMHGNNLAGNCLNNVYIPFTVVNGELSYAESKATCARWRINLWRNRVYIKTHHRTVIRPKQQQPQYDSSGCTAGVGMSTLWFHSVLNRHQKAAVISCSWLHRNRIAFPRSANCSNPTIMYVWLAIRVT